MFSEILSSLSIIISLIVAYKTVFARFNGKVSLATRVILTHVDKIPSIGIACFFENSGALSGIIDDLRIIVKHNESGTITYFYPHVLRNDYSIFKSYNDGDWFPFSTTTLSAHQRMERYIIFKPKYDEFKSQVGKYSLTLESQLKDQKWKQSHELKFNISEEVASHWNTPEASAMQVLADSVLEKRNFGK
ncbi:MAG: hypothetical protein KJZ77_05735 [Anaerolineales bacterium]|nr:hypothetical protein [Anaerolineales bacterium]